jgi:hypothetical protein
VVAAPGKDPAGGFDQLDAGALLFLPSRLGFAAHRPE